MDKMRRKWRVPIGRLVLLILFVQSSAPAAARTLSAGPRPFILPFADLPGPNTWYLGGGYGNTTGAYIQRNILYRAGQGLHFGLDMAAPCGTRLVAIGDGSVAAVDEPAHGSLPHNLLIRLDAGYYVLYGHLLERAKLAYGQRVKQGEVVGLSGDSFATCHSAPHLHLEIRNANNSIALNPVNLIEADWDALALIGSFQRGFERDLDDPRRWQYPDDQPETHFGGPMLNNFARPWPPDWERR